MYNLSPVCTIHKEGIKGWISQRIAEGIYLDQESLYIISILQF